MNADFPLHFLRPLWLCGLLLLPLLWLWLRRRAGKADVWADIIDPHLRPHVLEGDTAASSPRNWRILTACALALLALAGPAWRKLPQPLWQSGYALVLAVDLSSATLARDMQPSRLLQMRAKLAQLLARRVDGQTGLLAFAADAHTVSPLSDDAANIALFIDALAPEIMPEDGHNPARAIALASTLLQRAGAVRGDILLMTGEADGKAEAAARAAQAQGYRVSILALGSERGAQVRLRDGRSRQVRLELGALERVAAAGGGGVLRMRADESDWQALGLAAAGAAREDERTQALWRDEGFWLLPPLMLLLLWEMRNRAAGGILLLALATALPLRAAETATNGSWWLRPEQQQYRLQKKAEAAYDAGDHARAAELYAQIPGPSARYNLGNALARQGHYEQALLAYDEALQQAPRMRVARENRARVLQLLVRQRQQQQQQQQQQQTRPQQPNAPAPHPDAGRQANAGSKDGATAPMPARHGVEETAAAAQREAMQRALQQAQATAGNAPTASRSGNATAVAGREQQQAVESWLRRVPDTPGEWLQRKFWLEHQRRRAGEE